MGNPSHYSRDLPDRCFQLITKLWPAVQETYADGQEDLGPLTTTFLLAMANPIIVLPIERIERHRGKEIGGYVNDRPLDEHLAQAVDRALGSAPFRNCRFFEAGQWRFARASFQHQNFAQQFPDDLRELLDRDDALEEAASLQAAQWASYLRNAISHGGVSYLDQHGRADHSARATMLAFVSATYPKFPKGHLFEGRRDTSRPPIALNVLRITEQDFCAFLRSWVDWLKASGLSHSLTNAA
jgi:hypothetical protein